jgi:hypothetical protein
MMSERNYEEALRAAQNLTQRSDEFLFEELGLRIRDMQNIKGYERSTHYSADFSQVAEDMLSMEDLKKVGRKWYSKMEKVLMDMICDPQNEEVRKITSGKTIPQVAASLATAAVISALAPPAWIIVATSLFALKIAETGIEAICETWKESSETGQS